MSPQRGPDCRHLAGERRGSKTRFRMNVRSGSSAVLKSLGANDAIMGRRVFEQEQIARAVDLGPDEHLGDRYPSLSEGAHRGWASQPPRRRSLRRISL